MPAAGQGSGKSSAGERRARKRRERATPPPPPPAPFGSQGAFGAASSQRPFAGQQREAAANTRRAAARLPAPTIAAPPVIQNPTRKQTQAAARAINTSLTRIVGSRGSSAERLARRDAILDRVRTDPRMTNTRASLEHWTNEVAKISRPQRDVARPGRPPTRVRLGAGPVNFGTVNLTATGQAIGSALAQAAPGLQSASAEAQFVKNAFSDVGTLATAPFVAAVGLGGVAKDVVTGHPGRAAGKTFDFGKGVVQGTIRDWSHPGQYLREHPLLFGLDVAGATAIAGRTAGAVARGVGSQAERGGLRGSLARGGSTVRPPLALSEDAAAPLTQRTYSKDLTRKTAQVAADATREPLRRPDGSVVTVTDRGREVPVLKARARPTVQHPTGERGALLKQAADTDASRANLVERMVREEASHEFSIPSRARARVAAVTDRALRREAEGDLRRAGIKGRRARDLVAMVVEGTITSAKHFTEDLTAERDRIKGKLDEHEQTGGVYRHKGEVNAAAARLRLVDDALSNPKLKGQRDAIVKIGEDIGRRLNDREGEAIKLGLLDPKRASRSRLVVPAVAHLRARHFTGEELRGLEDVSAEALRHGAIRHADGRFLSNKEVEAFLKDRGRDPGSVAYLPHRLDVRGRRAFHSQFRPGTRGSLEGSETRTGRAYEKGVTESSANLIREQGVRQRVQINKAQAVDRMIGDMGLKHPDGRYFTAREAIETADRLERDTGERLVPVRAFAARLDPETQRIIREDLQGPGAMESLGERLLNDRVVRFEDPAGAARARNVVLVPADYVERLQKHLRPAGEITKLLQAINRPFRFAVLAQPRWLTGNFVEPYIVRLTVNGSGLNVFGLGMDITAATRMIRRAERSGDPRVRRAAQEWRAHQLGGLGIGGRGLSVRREATDLESGQFVSKLPVVGQGFDLLRATGRALMTPGNAYFRLNRAVENVAQRAALGRDVRRDMQEFTGSWTKTLRLHKDALDEAAQGLVNTATQRRFMKSQHEILGKYEGYPPWLRTLIQGPLPFVPWMLNAARFTLWTMPAHHTALTALLTRVNDVMAKDWKEIHANVPPGGLKYAVPTKDGGWLDLARYTPYGLTTPIVGSEGKDLQSVTDQFLPQASSAIAALTKGEDPFGRDLELDPTENQGVKEPNLTQRLGIALYGLAESNVPYLSQARRLREGGGTAYAGSTIMDPDTKPGTKRMSGFNRTFNPLRPTYLGAGAAGSVTEPEPSQASSQQGLPASVQQVLRANAAVQHAGQLPASVQRALRQVR